MPSGRWCTKHPNRPERDWLSGPDYGRRSNLRLKVRDVDTFLVSGNRPPGGDKMLVAVRTRQYRGLVNENRRADHEAVMVAVHETLTPARQKLP